MIFYHKAAVYSTTLEKSAVEFATAYINQQSAVDPLYWLATLNISTISNNEMASRNTGMVKNCIYLLYYSMYDDCIMHIIC